jgi:SAM-dependent methyltransferase
MTGIAEWQARVGRAWADEWQRTDRSFAGLTPQLLQAIAAQPGTRVLDLGCGAGELSLAVADARPDAQVVGVDVSADLVAVAQARGAGRAKFHHADAGAFVDPAGPPDLLISRHGVMFFADPPMVFRHLAHHAAPGARLVFSCFRTPAENPWAGLFAPLFPPLPPAEAVAFSAGPFAFADPAHVERCLAGWTGLRFTSVDFSYVAGAGDDPLADAIGFFSRIGPAASRLAALDGTARAELQRAMAAVLAPHLAGGKVAFPAAAWIVTAISEHSDRANPLVPRPVLA